jgi:hypothetical protein
MGKTKHPNRGGTRRGVRDASSMGRKSHSTNSTGFIDFKQMNRVALQSLPAIVARWLPNGKRVGHEYVALNPKRPDKHLGSFKVALAGSRAGAWADFATGDKGGDVISLAAYLFNLSQLEAARRVAKMIGLN